MRLFRSTNIDFLGLTKPCVTGSPRAHGDLRRRLIATSGLNWGVDFTGGAQVVYAFSAKPDEDQIRKIVEGAKVPVTSVQRYDKAEKNQVLLRVPMEKKEGRDVSGEVTTALTTALFPKGLEAGRLRPEPQRRSDRSPAKLQQDDPEKMAGARGRRPEGRVRADRRGDHRGALRRRGSSPRVDAGGRHARDLAGRRAPG